MIAIKNVLVATDFSEPAAVALDYGRELARSYLARLHVLHVADDMMWRYSLEMTPAFAEIQESLREVAAEKMNTLLTDEDRQELHAVGIVETAPAAAERIVAYAKRATIDVVVMGTHGRGALGHLLMGSVAERVVRAAPCPVLTVRCHEREFIAPDALVTTVTA